MPYKPKILFTDGEGPIVYKDLAYDLTRRAFKKTGQKSGLDFFRILSFYDDYLAEINYSGYQAGDTLALVGPTFLAHGLTDRDINDEAKTTAVVPGVKDYITHLLRDGWQVRIISTAYRAMWDYVGDYLGIPPEHIACTELSLTKLHALFNNYRFRNAVTTFECEVLTHQGEFNEAIAEVHKGVSIVEVMQRDQYRSLFDLLDGFFWKMLPAQFGYAPLREIMVMGGNRKIKTAKNFARKLGTAISDIVYVGDSITDAALFRILKTEGGLAIVVNGSSYGLREAEVAVATTDMRSLRPLLNEWVEGGHEKVREFLESKPVVSKVRARERAVNLDETQYAYIHPEDANTFARLLEAHKAYRVAVRGQAALLG